MKQDISIIRGTNNSFVIHVNDADGNPFTTDSNQRVIFALKKNIRDKEPALVRIPFAMTAPGQYWLGLSPHHTLDLLPGKYYYDVGLESGGTNFFNIIEPSEFIIKPNVSELGDTL